MKKTKILWIIVCCLAIACSIYQADLLSACLWIAMIYIKILESDNNKLSETITELYNEKLKQNKENT